MTHAPLTKRYITGNQFPFMNKEMIKEIMNNLRLRNTFLNKKSFTDRKAYNKQRNHVPSLLRNEKKNFYSNLNTKVVTDNIIFWKIVRSFTSEKATEHFKINLFEGKKFISFNDKLLKSSFNENLQIFLI